ncbi:Inhibitor of apoptosis-promoting Bax1 [Mesomycoplasma conjunctivae]|nr:Bax inhibitor-1 family protein [Mesomycoplasma conjunctivae]VEU66619.1 Inhibitor of apoptosis-promoting Bax1 [Mesomycoplasma conjunctivae]
MLNFRSNRITYNMVSTDTKIKTDKLLAYSLMWLGSAIALIAILSFAIISSPRLFKLYLDIVGIGGKKLDIRLIIIFIVTIVLNIGIFFFISKTALKQKPHTAVLATLYFILILSNSIFLPFVFAQYIARGQAANILIAFFATGGITIFMGLLGYYKIINFGKLVPLLILGIVVEVIIGITSLFVFNSLLTTIYLALGFGISVLMIGYQFWQIRNQGSYILANYADDENLNRIMLRLSILYGINLFFATIRIFLATLRYLDLLKK